jgi:hypothetical protein
MTDFERFSVLCGQIIGKRLKYQELIGKEEVREDAF